ncbi:GPI mannosyltransferase 3 [Dufourea novaeangliae]|uniref:Mannosyltransferase n=1 Tax=Dufourea novaeangliae TaxID=178035 RepID=A0A154PB81_DUFNO|nr:GPI mannosyltransferase 3 [Dufourea novaeangliae]
MYLPRKYKILLLLLVWRLSSVFLVQTAHVPDEYWQSLEVAHHLAFGYGYLTWEWTANIRNYIYPFLISIIYRILALMSLDYVTVLTTVPRIFQALISAYGEFKFYQWTKNKWTLYSLCINWYWYYCATRTLINTVETAYSFCCGTLIISPWEFFLTNIVPGFYFSMIHQRGALDAMNILRKEITNTSNTTNMLFLTPCHATPLYSHLHVNLPIRILTCEPNFHNSTNYVDEADAFLADPMQWLSHNYNENDAATIPTHVITFDTVSPKIVQFLEHYQLISEIFYTHFPQSNYGTYIHIYKLK